jgi:hypothetical protein
MTSILSKRVQMAIDQVSPSLKPGEEVETAVYTNVGSVSVKRYVATAAVVAVATAGMFTAVARPRRAYVVLTSQRLVIIDGQTSSGKPGKTVATMPRAGVSLAKVRKTLLGVVKLDLVIQGQEKGLQLVFPTVLRKSGQAFAAVLQANDVPSPDAETLGANQ